MNKYLSFGGGVNSVALMLLLKDRGEEVELVFANHGCDYPETYEYMEYLKTKGFEITEVKPNYDGCTTLWDYCVKHRVTPSRTRRWCTGLFKIEPLLNYYKKPCVQFIGYSFDERKRAFKWKEAKGVKTFFPLIDGKVARNDCINIIKEHSLKIPVKSMCFICPFQTNEELKFLFEHEKLYEKALYLEKINKGGFYIKDKPLDEVRRRLVGLEAKLREAGIKFT